MKLIPLQDRILVKRIEEDAKTIDMQKENL
jgi:co-chaperonin GroES (HSP10)